MDRGAQTLGKQICRFIAENRREDEEKEREKEKKKEKEKEKEIASLSISVLGELPRTSYNAAEASRLSSELYSDDKGNSNSSAMQKR